MNLSQFKVIPQSNTSKENLSLEDLKPLFVPEVIKPDLFYDAESERFRVKLSFIKNIVENEGFTAITDGTSTYLLKTSTTDKNKDLHPKFLKSNVTQYFKSDYLRLLTKDLGNDLFLHETKIEDYTAFLVNASTTNPFISTNYFENEIVETNNVIENLNNDLVVTHNVIPFPEKTLVTKVEKAVLTEDEIQQLVALEPIPFPTNEQINSITPAYLNDKLDEVVEKELVTEEVPQIF